jgi:DNA-binding transcriptional LysR family regulator
VQSAAVLEFNSIEAIKQSAMIDMGVGVLPAAAAAAEVSQGKLVVLPWRGKPISIGDPSHPTQAKMVVAGVKGIFGCREGRVCEW